MEPIVKPNPVTQDFNVLTKVPDQILISTRVGNKYLHEVSS
jgi:hypothetical protein